MNRLTQIAQELNALYRTKWTLGIRLTNLRKDEEARKLFITPEGGWQGKNAEERKFTENVFCAGDEVLKQIRQMIVVEQNEYDGTLAMIDGLTDERRAFEWTIRAKLVDALAGNNAASNTIESAFKTDQEFDDAAQDEADLASFGLADAVVTEFSAKASDEENAAAFFSHEPREEAPPAQGVQTASSQDEFPF